jgi:gamma-butyrobetaine dioxygenase
VSFGQNQYMAVIEQGHATLTLTSALRDTNWVTVRWSNGHDSPFHYVWLRDNCGCAECRHVIAGERMSDPASIPLDLIATDVVTVDDSLLVTWPDAHRSSFSAQWLAAHAYDSVSRARSRRPLQLWNAADVAEAPPTAQFDEVMSDDTALLEWLLRLQTYGFTIVRGMGSSPGNVPMLAKRIAFLRDSNFGQVWEVRSEPKPDSLAYTSVKLTAHTDLVSREAQPGVQFLHCMVNEAQGGESILVDGFAVAEALRQQNLEAWQTLIRVPAAFRYQNDDTDVCASFPVIRLDHRNEYFEVRYSNALLAPLDCDRDDVLPFYAAYQAFSLLLREPRFEYSFRLEAGDCEVFDNRRVMHGRQAFDPNTGRRHLQGCYVDTDDFLSRIRVLQRQSDFRLR